MNPNVVIGAAIGGGVCLIADAGIAWIVRQRARKTQSQQESATTGPTELVIVNNHNFYGLVSFRGIFQAVLIYWYKMNLHSSLRSQSLTNDHKLP